MNCERAERLLALAAGGDLGDRESSGLQEHLAECDHCRALEGHFSRSRAWLESAPQPPDSEADYADLRRGVWREIERRGVAPAKAFPAGGRAILAGGGLLAAVLAALLFGRRAAEPESAAPVRIAEPSAAAASPGSASPVRDAVAPAVSPGLSAESHRPVVRRRGTAPEPGEETVRIEFRTANPNVRIIWLVKKGEEKSSALASRNEEVS
jgi:anti-sigma factor RsiW